MTKDRYLFRGFHKEENGKETIYIDGQPIKGKWVEGYLVEHTYKDTVYIDGTSPKTSYIFPMDERSQLKSLEKKIEVIPETIGQSVGLSDKNGRLIFENDVLLRTLYDDEGKEYLKAEYIVVFDIEQPRFIISENWEELRYMNWKRSHKKYNQQLGSFGVKTSECEVIGTIFDKEVKDNE